MGYRKSISTMSFPLKLLRKGALLVDVRTREQIQSQTNGRIPQGAMVLPLDGRVGCHL